VPEIYTDWAGEQLHADGNTGDLRLMINDDSLYLDIAAADVRKVTGAMHAEAGLPDRWAGLRERLTDAIATLEGLPPAPGSSATEVARGVTIGAYRGVLAWMDAAEAGQ
jgi:hypothetical protein